MNDELNPAPFIGGNKTLYSSTYLKCENDTSAESYRESALHLRDDRNKSQRTRE